jgi:hypothetical protein
MTVLLTSCHSTHNLDEIFNCTATKKLNQLETITDFKSGFSVDIPKSWNTKLYYDELNSEIFTADTLKTLQETFIMEFAMINSALKLDNHFIDELQRKTTQDGLTTIKKGMATFDKHKGYYHLGQGTAHETPIQIFQWYIPVDEMHYFRIKTQIYGQENADERLCESFQLINHITFIK